MEALEYRNMNVGARVRVVVLLSASKPLDEKIDYLKRMRDSAYAEAQMLREGAARCEELASAIGAEIDALLAGD